MEVRSVHDYPKYRHILRLFMNFLDQYSGGKDAGHLAKSLRSAKRYHEAIISMMSQLLMDDTLIVALEEGTLAIYEKDKKVFLKVEK